MPPASRAGRRESRALGHAHAPTPTSTPTEIVSAGWHAKPMNEVLTGDALPPGSGSVNPFVSIRGPGGAPAFISFAEQVFGARETLAAHTIDADDLLIHAEVRIGDSTVMLCDAKPHWAFTPALLQVYVSEVDPVLGRAVARGATVITETTDFHGGQRLARFQDPWHNVWWLFEYGAASTAPSEAPDELPRWRPDPAAPPSYAHRTIDAALSELKAPESTGGSAGDEFSS
jgi:PhnB protein